MPRPWSLEIRNFTPPQQRRAEHMIPETAEGVSPELTQALVDVAAGVSLIANAVQRVSGRVAVYTAGNLAAGAAPFVSLTVLPQPDASAEGPDA